MYMHACVLLFGEKKIKVNTTKFKQWLFLRGDLNVLEVFLHLNFF